ncbi:MAG: hypothetical protein K8R79_05810 [Calditrichales bacterium]|nr:hypothetical protein [Calditrichales bacterium]
MDKKKIIEHEVEEILRGFDHVEKIKSNPFLHTRVLAAIKDTANEQTESGIYPFFEKAIRPAFIIGIILVNLVTAGFALTHKNSQKLPHSQIISNFAEEYYFSQNDYDIIKINVSR